MSQLQREADVTPRRLLILGAAGRDFHDFQVVFRDDPSFEVVAFTATQIPRIAGRRFPAALAGDRYPEGLPILPEDDLEEIVRERDVDEVVLAYSDLSWLSVGALASRVTAAGADFRLVTPRRSMLEAPVPVVAVTAVRTGCGKSQTSRHVVRLLRDAGRRPVVVRHPMPYGQLAVQAVQRFETYEDLERHDCTFEEREEYEPHVAEGTVVHAGVDYAAILERASRDGDVLVWDGGNNDTPFYRPDLWICVTDPLRPGHVERYWPSAVNARGADVIVVNKVDSASPEAVEQVVTGVRGLNARAEVVLARSRVSVEDPDVVKGRRVACVEDGPTLTHGEMSFGAAAVAAERFGAAEVVDPRPHAVRSIRATLEAHPHVGPALPAMGYYPEQVADLEESLRATDCDVVLVGTPFDLARRLDLHVPAVRVRYELEPLEGGEVLARLVRTVTKR